MFCSKCGQELLPTARFCSRCGTKQETIEVNTPKPVIPKIGDILMFGHIDHEDNKIPWVVLDSVNNELLLLCRNIISEQIFNSGDYQGVVWSNCSVRQWLNSEFLELCFSNNELERIVTKEIRTDIKAGLFGSKIGNDVSHDRVFLLSMDEVLKYLPTPQSRALHNRWWLRSPGSDNEYVAAVFDNGKIDKSGFLVDRYYGGIRPAVWISTTVNPKTL